MITAYHMMVCLTVYRNAVCSTYIIEMIILSIICESIPFPIVHIKSLLPVNCHLREIIYIYTVSNVDRISGFTSFSCLLNNIRKISIEVISASRSNPYAEITSEFSHKFTGCRQLIWKFLIKRPKSFCINFRSWLFMFPCRNSSVIICVPSVIHYIRIQWADFCFVQLTVNFNKRFKNVLIINEHHIIEPWIVLCTELWRSCDWLDILEEVCLNNFLLCTSCRSRNCLPCHILIICCQLIVFFQSAERLTAVIAHESRSVNDLCIRSRELTSEEHSLNVDRLSEVRFELFHLYDAAFSSRDRPLCVVFWNFQRFKVDVVDLSFCHLFIRNIDLEEFTHEVIAFIHYDYFVNRVLYAFVLIRFERKRYFLTSLLCAVDRCCRILNFNCAVAVFQL